MAEHNELGKWGEDEATLYLENEGYVVIDRDWKAGKRDLDILAVSPDGKEQKVDRELRFDVVTVVGVGHQVKRIEHLVDAFNPLLI